MGVLLLVAAATGLVAFITWAALPHNTGPVDLDVRRVLASEPATATSCPPPTAEPATSAEVILCSSDGAMRYTLGPVEVSGDHVVDVVAEAGSFVLGYGAAAHVSYDAEGEAAVSAMLSSLSSTRGYYAMVTRGRLQSVSLAEDTWWGWSHGGHRTLVVLGFDRGSDADRFVEDIRR